MKRYQYEISMNISDFEEIPYHKNEYEKMIFEQEINEFLENITGNKKKIVYDILVAGRTDHEIAEELIVSRQYVNRIRRKYYKKYRDLYLADNNYLEKEKLKNCK